MASGTGPAAQREGTDMTTPGDINGDGISDLTGVHDSTGDGIADTYTFDQNRDGYAETVASDLDQDLKVERVDMDTNLDGYTDVGVVDSNEDGEVDHIVDSRPDLIVGGGTGSYGGGAGYQGGYSPSASDPNNPYSNDSHADSDGDGVPDRYDNSPTVATDQ